MKSIRNQMLVYLVLLAVVTFSSMGYFTAQELKKLTPYVEKQYMDIANLLSDKITNEIERDLEQVKMLSKLNIVQEMDMEKSMAFLKEVNLSKKYMNIGLFDINGKGRNTNDVQIDVSSQDQYKQLILGDKEHWISQPFISSFTKENIPIITVSHVVKRNEEKVGLINIVFSTAFLAEVVSSIDIGKTGSLRIIDGEGNIVANSSTDINMTDNTTNMIKTQNIVDEIMSNKTGMITYVCPDGEKFLVTFSEIKSSPKWKFIVSIPCDEAFKETNAIINFFKFMIPIYFVIIASILYIYSGRLLKPVENLKNIFDRAAKGDLNVKADEKIKNELGEAGKSFNEMLYRIKGLMYKDPVTGLYNTNRFMLELPHKVQELNKEQGIAAICITSIYDFIRVNSISGHKTGDKVLRALGKRILDFKTSSEMVGRYYGDEIIALLWAKDYESLENKINKLWQLCDAPMSVNNYNFRFKTNIGVSVIPKGVDNYYDIIHEATIAKLKVKNSGGDGYIFFNEDIRKIIQDEKVLDDEISKALGKDEFYLVYQPIVDIKTGEIVSNEALLRWDNERYSNLPIPVVIEFAERKGYIEDIGSWVLKEACRQNKQWQDEGLGFTCISVNISVIQIEKPDFVDRVKEALKFSNLSPEYLELEITETVDMGNVNEKLEKMLQLKELGIKISVDDFGTGYSSLSYFTKFPIDTLKIDKSFVSDMMNDANDMTIIDTIINMAKAMNVAVTAEGVETKEHMEKLRSMGADKIQGYYVGKPKKALELEEMLKKSP